MIILHIDITYFLKKLKFIGVPEDKSVTDKKTERCTDVMQRNRNRKASHGDCVQFTSSSPYQHEPMATFWKKQK